MVNHFDAHSFDWYGTAHINAMGWTASASAGAVSYAIGPYGRNGTQGLKLARTTTANANALARAIRRYATTQTPITGIAFKTNVLPPAGQVRIIGQWLDGASSQIEMYLLDTGAIQFKRGATVLGTTTAFFVAINAFYFLDTKVKVDNTTGTIDLLVDDGNFASVNVLSLNGLDTQATGNATSDGFALCHQAGSVNDVSDNYFDDYYHTDPTDSVYPEPLGNVFVQPYRPNANGDHQDFAAVGAPVAYQAVNEELEDEDVTYILATDINAQASFRMTQAAINADILAVILTHVSKETDTGREMAPQWTIKGVDYLGTPVALTTSYAAYQQAYTVDPSTGVKWITPGFNTTQIGEKVTT